MSEWKLTPEYSDEETSGFGDPEYDEKVEHIKTLIPLVSRLVIREELEMHAGNVKKTVKQLKRLRPISALTKEFPKLDIEVITHILQKNSWDEESARGDLQKILDKYKTIKRKKKEESTGLQRGGGGGGGGESQTFRPPSPPPPQTMTSPRSAPAAPPPEPEDNENLVRALFDYQTGHPAKLEFKKGDILLLTNGDGDAWWYGKSKSGNTGKFPKSYVRRMDEDMQAKVLYDFNVTGDQAGRLQAEKGEIIFLLNKRKGSQWWEAVTAESLVGMIPVSYFSVLSNRDTFTKLDQE